MCVSMDPYPKIGDANFKGAFGALNRPAEKHECVVTFLLLSY